MAAYNLGIEHSDYIIVKQNILAVMLEQ